MKALTMEQMVAIEGGECSFADVMAMLGFAAMIVGTASALITMPATASLWVVARTLGWATLRKVIGISGFVAAVQSCTSS